MPFQSYDNIGSRNSSPGLGFSFLPFQGEMGDQINSQKHDPSLNWRGEQNQYKNILDAQRVANDLRAKKNYQLARYNDPVWSRFRTVDERDELMQSDADIQRADYAAAMQRQLAVAAANQRARYAPELDANNRAQQLGYASAAQKQGILAAQGQLQSLLSGLMGIFAPFAAQPNSATGPLSGLVDTAIGFRDMAQNPIGGIFGATRPTSSMYRPGA